MLRFSFKRTPGRRRMAPTPPWPERPPAWTRHFKKRPYTTAEREEHYRKSCPFDGPPRY